MKKRRTLIWVLLGAALLLLGAALLLLGAGFLLFYLDEPPPMDDDLRLVRAEVPAGENGFYAVQVGPEEKFGLPETLAELVPRHLKEVPADPFDGKPIRYSPEKRLIYSIGRDRIDSGGSGPEEGRGDDPTFKFEL